MRLTQQEVLEKLQAFTGWTYHDNSLHKTYGFGEYSKVMEFVNKVAMIAEKQKHHPDMLVQHGTVTLSTTTHDANGVTPKDFDFIKILEQLAVEML